MNDFKVPDWAASAPPGTHLDVCKGDQLLQKLLVDEKSHYYFGRNPETCDFVVEHASCSRVHAVLLFHKVLGRFALVDLQSSHGTYVGARRIEPMTPVFLNHGDWFQLGASTRRYVAREGLEAVGQPNDKDDPILDENNEDIDSLTEFNTAQNRRTAQIRVPADECRWKSRPRPNLSFCDGEEIINPEDIDPAVGRFRNLIRTAVIPSSSLPSLKRPAAVSHSAVGEASGTKKSNVIQPTITSLDHGPTLFNAAPELYGPDEVVATGRPADQPSARFGPSGAGDSKATDHKKYVKEAWPGRNSGSMIT